MPFAAASLSRRLTLTCLTTIACCLAAVGQSAAQTNHLSARAATSRTVESASAHTTATSLCGVVHPRAVMSPTGTLDTTKPASLSTPVGPGDLHIANGLIY